MQSATVQSNVEPRARLRLPWALFGAIAIIAGVEATLRLTNWPTAIPYEQGLGEYHAVAATLDAGDPPEVIFVGSSRTRESIHLPTLRSLLATALRRKVSVANYGLSGARAHEFAALTHRLLREPRPPKLIVCGVSERDFALGFDDQGDHAPIFWSVDDWRKSPIGDSERLPIAIRNDLAQGCRLLQFRETLRTRIVQRLLREDADATPSPLQGEETPFQLKRRGRSLAERPMSMERVQVYVQALHLLEDFPNAEMVQSFETMLRDCKAANVKLILYEVPTPTILRDNLPPGTYDTYLATVDKAARATSTPFIHVGDLPMRLNDRHFLEQSHMNQLGSRVMTLALGKSVLANELKPKPKVKPSKKAKAAQRKPSKAARARKSAAGA